MHNLSLVACIAGAHAYGQQTGRLFPHCITLSRPVVVKQLPGPILSKLMAQFNIDVDSGIIRISLFIYSICPGVSQATLFSRAFVVPVVPALHNTPLLRNLLYEQQPYTLVWIYAFRVQHPVTTYHSLRTNSPLASRTSKTGCTNGCQGR